MAKKETSKDLMLAHSAAKIEYYQKYLARYLSILSVSVGFDKVNIFDVFCGRGVYDDGGLGSPIRTVDTVIKTRKSHPSTKIINLFFNDSNEDFVRRSREYIDENFPDHKSYCDIKYSCMPASELFGKLLRFLPRTSYKTRNFLFVDPYGYKEISSHTIESLMCNKNTEMLLFLPISFMHRFTHYSFNEDANKGAAPLRELICQLFPEGHRIMSDEPMDALEYIASLAEAFSFGGKYYTSSFFIERDKRNYFALFSICNNLLGLEKAIETKWDIDEQDGKGFRIPDSQQNMFADQFKTEDAQKHFEHLKSLLLKFLDGSGKSNGEIYRFILGNGYLPKHANEVLRSLQYEKKIIVTFPDGSPARKNAFYIDYKHSDINKVQIRLIR